MQAVKVVLAYSHHVSEINEQITRMLHITVITANEYLIAVPSIPLATPAYTRFGSAHSKQPHDVTT